MKNSFLQQTARSIIETIDWKQLNRTTLVLPSHRAGLVLKDELLRLQQERQAQAVWAPEICTLPQLQDRLSPLFAEDELMTIVRLYRLYTTVISKSSAVSLDVFYGWGRQMLADFTNIDASMPAEEVPNFFENTIAAHELSQWRLDEEVEQRLRSLINPMTLAVPADSVRKQYEQVWHQLFELYKGLRAEMIAEQKGYSGLRQRSVIENWNTHEMQAKIEGRTFIFVGFNYLLPVERELMERLREAKQALFYWDYVADFPTNEKAFSFAKFNSSKLGNALCPQKWEKARPVTIMSCTSREAQAQYVHQWLKANYTVRGQHVGVVICDETMLEPVIYTLPSITLPNEQDPAAINITKGFPLRNTQVYSEVLHWLYDRQRGDAEQVINVDFIEQLLAALFPEKQYEQASLDEPERTKEQEAPKGLPWQELLILESEYQVRKIINQMRQIVSAGLGEIPFTLKLLRLLIRRAMESVTMPFHGEPITDIQVMGVLETRMLDFDNLLILNVEEGVIPQHQNDCSFIPFYLRKAYHMQTSDERATVYAYNFFRLLSRAEHATILYSEPNNADSCKGKSRFIMQMLVSPDFNVTKKSLVEANTLQPFLVDVESMTFAPYSSIMRPNQMISPSAINTYIACPRKFAWRYIMGIHEPTKEEKDFAPSTMGSFVHYAMEHIYRKYFECDNTTPKLISPDEIERIRTDKEVLQEALNYAYEKMQIYLPEQHVNDNTLILGYVNNILERDREDARKGLQIWMLEKQYELQLTIENVGKVRIGGMVDRLDIIAQKDEMRFRVVDYKTGAFNPAKDKDGTQQRKMTASWDEVANDSNKDYIRQTLLYSLAVAKKENIQQAIEPNLYFCQRKLTDELPTRLTVDEQVVLDAREVENNYIAAIQPKIKEILTTTSFPLCEEDKCPKYCPYFKLCGRTPKEF